MSNGDRQEALWLPAVLIVQGAFTLWRLSVGIRSAGEVRVLATPKQAEVRRRLTPASSTT
jgi:hypothetical protein